MFRQWFARWRRPQSLGRRGENAAARFLKKQGYTIVARGRRVGFGELDLVAVDPRGTSGRTVVFVEVKTRASLDKGHPAEAVDKAKQQKLTRIALAYLKRHGLLEYPARFDVVAIVWPAAKKKPTLEHIKNAFEATGEGQMFS